MRISIVVHCTALCSLAIVAELFALDRNVAELLCFALAAAGGPCCMRCGNGIPHSKYASFYTFVDILLEEVPGLKLSKPVLDEMAGR